MCKNQFLKVQNSLLESKDRELKDRTKNQKRDRRAIF